jgi:hypothetical protein
MGLTYGKRNGDITERVHGYCDADYAMDGDRKSISGLLATLAGCRISWQAKKQTTVAQWRTGQKKSSGFNTSSRISECRNMLLQPWFAIIRALSHSQRIPLTTPNEARRRTALFHQGSRRKRDYQGGVLPHGGYACGRYDEGVGSRKARKVVSSDGNGDLRGYRKRYAIFIGWIHEWEC